MHDLVCACSLVAPVWLQVVASEAEGQVSRSEKRQVALKTAKTGISQLVTPRKPLPLKISHVEKLMLWLDWTRTFNRFALHSGLEHCYPRVLGWKESSRDVSTNCQASSLCRHCHNSCCGFDRR